MVDVRVKEELRDDELLPACVVPVRETGMYGISFHRSRVVFDRRQRPPLNMRRVLEHEYSILDVPCSIDELERFSALLCVLKYSRSCGNADVFRGLSAMVNFGKFLEETSPTLVGFFYCFCPNVYISDLLFEHGVLTRFVAGRKSSKSPLAYYVCIAAYSDSSRRAKTWLAVDIGNDPAKISRLLHHFVVSETGALGHGIYLWERTYWLADKPWLDQALVDAFVRAVPPPRAHHAALARWRCLMKRVRRRREADDDEEDVFRENYRFWTNDGFDTVCDGSHSSGIVVFIGREIEDYSPDPGFLHRDDVYRWCQPVDVESFRRRQTRVGRVRCGNYHTYLCHHDIV